MHKKRLYFLYCELKAALKAVPRLLICSVLMLAFVGLFAFFGYRYYNSKASSAAIIQVAAVFPADDADVLQGYELINQMESVSSVCRLVQMSEADAYSALADHRVSAIIIIPENFANDLMYGVNTPAKVVLPNDSGIETMLFRSLMDAGALSLANSEAGMYAVLELFTEHDHQASADFASEHLYKQYIKYTLNRGTFFKSQTISATGNVSTADYYIASAVVLVLLLCLIGTVDYFFGFSAETLSILRVNRIPAIYVKFCELFSISLIFGGLSCIALFSSGWLDFSISNFGVIMLLAASVVSLVMLIATVFCNSIAAILSIFTASIGMMYLCGRLMPPAYLPTFVARIGDYLPAKHWCALLEGMKINSLSAGSLVYAAMSCLLCLAISGAVVIIRQRRAANE